MRAATAASTAGRMRICRIGIAGASVGSWMVDSWAIAKGSGRSRKNVRSAATLTKRIGIRYGPASSGSPNLGAMACPIGTSDGPTIPPTVEPQTTSPIATARRFGATRSAAA